MQKTTTWRKVPEFYTNFDVDPIQTKIFIRVTDIGDKFEENNPLIGSITFISCITKSILVAELQLNNIRIISKYLFIKH